MGSLILAGEPFSNLILLMPTCTFLSIGRGRRREWEEERREDFSLGSGRPSDTCIFRLPERCNLIV